MVGDMEVDMVADMETDIVADMEVDMVANYTLPHSYQWKLQTTVFHMFTHVYNYMLYFTTLKKLDHTFRCISTWHVPNIYSIM